MSGSHIFRRWIKQSKFLIRTLMWLNSFRTPCVFCPLYSIEYYFAYWRVQDWLSFAIKFGETYGNIKTFFSWEYLVILEMISLFSWKYIYCFLFNQICNFLDRVSDNDNKYYYAKDWTSVWLLCSLAIIVQFHHERFSKLI